MISTFWARHARMRPLSPGSGMKRITDNVVPFSDVVVMFDTNLAFESFCKTLSRDHSSVAGGWEPSDRQPIVVILPESIVKDVP